MVRMSAPCIGCVKPPGIILLLNISVRFWAEPRTTVRPEGLCHWKWTHRLSNPQLEAQYLNWLLHQVPLKIPEHSLDSLTNSKKFSSLYHALSNITSVSIHANVWNIAVLSLPYNTIFKIIIYQLDVHRSMYRNIKLIERTNKMQPCSRIYYSSVS
jgi:hypothetical protein